MFAWLVSMQKDWTRRGPGSDRVTLFHSRPMRNLASSCQTNQKLSAPNRHPAPASEIWP